MCCAVVTRDLNYPRPRQAHPTIHTVSPSGVPLLLRQRTQPPPSLAGGPGIQYSQARPPPEPPGDARARGNNFSVLPPIKDSGSRKDNTFTLSELDDISLKNEVVRRVKELPERALQGLLINLRAQDRDRDGILTSDVVKGTLRKFQLHLSDEGARNICKKFGRAGDHAAMVRYEDLVAYLTKSRMEAFKPPPPFLDQRTVGAKGSMTQQPQHQQQQPQQQQQRPKQQQQDPRKINLRNKVVFTDGDEAKLFVDMGRQLSNKPVNMADLRRTMYDLDRDRNDFLTGKQAETALYKCGVHLTPDLMARLLLATDRTGAGMYRIETLMNYLTRVVPETHYTVMLGNNHRPRQARVGQLPVFQNQSMLHAPWENNPQQHLETPKGISHEEHIEAEPMPPKPVPQQREPEHPPPLPPLPLVHTDHTEHEFDMQKWTNDYQYLAQAVYSADEDQSGYMPPDAVHRVAATYNLVYNLQISEPSFVSAIHTATDPNYGEVNLEYFITVLQDVHFRENQVY